MRALVIWLPLDDIDVPRWVCQASQRKAVISEIKTVEPDLSKAAVRVHGTDASGRAVQRRDQVLAFLSQAYFITSFCA
jgi:hypothetical protein